MFALRYPNAHRGTSPSSVAPHTLHWNNAFLRSYQVHYHITHQAVLVIEAFFVESKPPADNEESVAVVLYLLRADAGTQIPSRINRFQKLTELLSQLTFLDLSRVNLNGMHVQLLFNVLQQNQTIRTLSLITCGILPEGALFIAQMLAYNQTIEALYLDENSLGDKGLKLILDRLQENKTLAFLGLDNNHITDVGANYFLEYLSQHATSIRLSLKNNGIDPACLQPIESKCQQNQLLLSMPFTLEGAIHPWIGWGTVHVGFQPLSMPGYLQHNVVWPSQTGYESQMISSLQPDVKMTGNQNGLFQPQTYSSSDRIFGLIEQMSQAKNSIEIKLRPSYIQLCAELNQLTVLDFSNKVLTTDIMKIFCLALEHNKTIETLYLHQARFHSNDYAFVCLLDRNVCLKHISLSVSFSQVLLETDVFSLQRISLYDQDGSLIALPDAFEEKLQQNILFNQLPNQKKHCLPFHVKTWDASQNEKLLKNHTFNRKDKYAIKRYIVNGECQSGEDVMLLLYFFDTFFASANTRSSGQREYIRDILCKNSSWILDRCGRFQKMISSQDVFISLLNHPDMSIKEMMIHFLRSDDWSKLSKILSKPTFTTLRIKKLYDDDIPHLEEVLKKNTMKDFIVDECESSPTIKHFVELLLTMSGFTTLQLCESSFLSLDRPYYGSRDTNIFWPAIQHFYQQKTITSLTFGINLNHPSVHIDDIAALFSINHSTMHTLRIGLYADNEAQLQHAIGCIKLILMHNKTSALFIHLFSREPFSQENHDRMISFFRVALGNNDSLQSFNLYVNKQGCLENQAEIQSILKRNAARVKDEKGS